MKKRDGGIVKDLTKVRVKGGERKGSGGLGMGRTVIGAYMHGSQSVWTLPTKTIKNSLSQ